MQGVILCAMPKYDVLKLLAEPAPQDGLQKHSLLTYQLRDHVWMHEGRKIPPGESLLELRPPPGQNPHMPEPPWSPHCGKPIYTCKSGFGCALCHTMPRPAYWGPTRRG